VLSLTVGLQASSKIFQVQVGHLIQLATVTVAEELSLAGWHMVFEEDIPVMICKPIPYNIAYNT
jgi:hypothetical protein